MTRPILDFEKVAYLVPELGAVLADKTEAWREYDAALERQAQQAVAAEREKYQERIRVLEGELKLAAIAVADRAILNAAPMNAALDKLFGGGK